MKQPKEYYSIASERGERMGGGIFGSEEKPRYTNVNVG
jgi:hypothetical protein